MSSEVVSHPKHYTQHPSGVECIEVSENMDFCVGNAAKYTWRHGLKHEGTIDLEKALFYIDREIDRREDARASLDKITAKVCRYQEATPGYQGKIVELLWLATLDERSTNYLREAKQLLSREIAAPLIPS